MRAKIFAMPSQSVATIATTAAAITTVEIQPRTSRRRFTTNGPITSGFTASSIITTMIGTAAMPLITADQNRGSLELPARRVSILVIP